MKKTICCLFLIAIFAVKPAFAVVDAGLIKRVENIDKVQIIDTPTATPTAKLTLAPIRKEIKIIKQEAKVTKKQINKEKITLHFETIKKSLSLRYELLNSIKAKLADKINTEEYGKYSISYLEDLNNFENKIGEILTSETPGKIIPELRVAVKAVRTDLNSMHKLLADAIKLITSASKADPPTGGKKEL